jgi:hypothetical protein
MAYFWSSTSETLMYLLNGIQKFVFKVKYCSKSCFLLTRQIIENKRKKKIISIEDKPCWKNTNLYRSAAIVHTLNLN